MTLHVSAVDAVVWDNADRLADGQTPHVHTRARVDRDVPLPFRVLWSVSRRSAVLEIGIHFNRGVQPTLSVASA